MPLLRIHKQVRSSINSLLFDLLTGKPVDIGGYSVCYFGKQMPTPVFYGDRIEWMFREPVNVSITGPDLAIRTVIQYRDRLVIECGIMARIEVEFV